MLADAVAARECVSEASRVVPLSHEGRGGLAAVPAASTQRRASRRPGYAYPVVLERSDLFEVIGEPGGDRRYPREPVFLVGVASSRGASWTVAGSGPVSARRAGLDIHDPGVTNPPGYMK